MYPRRRAAIFSWWWMVLSGFWKFGGGRIQMAAALVGLLALLVWGALLLWPPPAQAHANLSRSTPAADAVLPQPPTRIALWFTEPIEPGLSEIQVLDAAGGRVDDGNSVVDPRDATAMSVGIDGVLPDGGYVVGWRNVSTIDGHLVRGSFRFSVGAAAAGPAPELPSQPLLQSPAEPAIRWLTLLGGLAAVGGLQPCIARHTVGGIPHRCPAWPKALSSGKWMATPADRPPHICVAKPGGG